eukprot:gnl/TRDRNA2_/TRDRNA2_37983_c0_seq1.p1 gnl/TRDRNA2_/TRDRNA2_37983_c0~~gnl/TRDRNA2_/TRDRNA2_37983_c0_seq1.p1  ORF type:complete len:174 (+),score=28.27 gnl/TRDRNA2_/TRDRNA2_37983_c0_seq1:33-554(+)
MALPIKRVPRRTEQERMSRLETLYNIDVERNRFKVCAYEPSLDGLAAAELSSAMKVPTGSVWQTGVGVCYEEPLPDLCFERTSTAPVAREKILLGHKVAMQRRSWNSSPGPNGSWATEGPRHDLSSWADPKQKPPTVDHTGKMISRKPATGEEAEPVPPYRSGHRKPLRSSIF